MEKAETIFEQKRAGTRLVFDFREDHLAFTHADSSGENKRNIQYEQIDLEHSSVLLVKGRRLSRPETLVVLGLVLVLSPNQNVSLCCGMFCLGLGVPLCIQGWRGIRYTFFRAGDGKIRIMQNHQHDRILGMLKEYRAAHLRKAYGTVDPSNDPAKELAKFQQLKALGAITEEEFAEADAQIRNLPRSAKRSSTTIQ